MKFIVNPIYDELAMNFIISTSKLLIKFLAKSTLFKLYIS